MIKKVEKKFKKVNSEKGFTLLEILVVLTIMGFLIAMVAPRLAGISGGAVDTVCDSNQNRMVTYMSSFYESTNRYPNHLTNLVNQDGTGASSYSTPEVSNQDPSDGAETLAKELDDRNHFQIHILDAVEAAELKTMGIVKLFNLNSYDGVTPTSAHASMDPVTPTANVGVAMVGVGYSGTAWELGSATERGWGEPDNFGRIVLGMGTECELITSGVISNAAHCPGGIQNDDNVTYNDYILLLPRLEATSAQMTSGTALVTAVIPGAANLGCIAYDGAPDISGYNYVGNTDNYKQRNFNITESQEGWQFATMCPEGHMYPADDEEFWAIDLDNLGTIN